MPRKSSFGERFPPDAVFTNLVRIMPWDLSGWRAKTRSALAFCVEKLFLRYIKGVSNEKLFISVLGLSSGLSQR